MDNKTDALLEKIKGTGVSFLKISKDTGIPHSRMYKWLPGKDGTPAKAAPKYEDVGLLNRWLKAFKQGIPFNSAVNEEKEEYGLVEIADKVLSHDALMAVIVAELASLRAERTGEPVQSIIRKLYKAAEDAGESLG